ncbi:hypothetical protein B0H63DRAFT_387925 [Podospora didyma]|uniref:UBX domain-containing protein n=1 Tax=Podospora didyma TaxID=330526 RepID=A0AAE0U7F8_9PEZI|nr:hypothetical protein B0H63DRAFT_387925 [Podospora didyma]
MSSRGEAAAAADLQQFMQVTDTDEAVARRALGIFSGNIEQALQVWFSDEAFQESLRQGGDDDAATRSPVGAQSSALSAGYVDAQGVIHLDSESESDVDMTGGDSDFDEEAEAAEEAASIARAAQEAEDAAMAARLQEELYGVAGAPVAGSHGGNDEVRAPMARTTETLVGPGGLLSDDGDDAAAAAMMHQIQQLRRRNGKFPITTTTATTTTPAGPSAGPEGPVTSRASHLADLFRPPYELMIREDWDEVRSLGKDEKKWILVNLQDASDFNCQVLNRDIWKDAEIKSLIRECFLFLQYEKSDLAAEQYISFYLPNMAHENPSNYPHVAIIDPRTGEQVKVWSGLPFPSAIDFYGQLVEFLDRYSLEANHKNPVSKAKRPERVVDVDRMTEDEMLQLAMQNSLENGGPSRPDVIDPDELTKATSTDVHSSTDKGKGRAVTPEELMDTEDTPAANPARAAFLAIPSDRPHVEPAANPASTTRLQVRFPPSRFIRRFNLDDPVSRIYEWLKAEPIPGKEGVLFELTTVPAGVNLLDLLTQSIKDAGLANGTVMIEFVEE